MRSAIILALMIGGVLSWAHWGPVSYKDAVETPPSAANTGPAAEQHLQAKQHLPYAAYVDVLEKPLFLPSRTKPERDAPEQMVVNVEVPQRSAALKDAVITGFVRTKKGTQVLLETRGDTEKDGVWLAEGQSYSGVEIVTIASDRVIVSNNGTEQVLPIGQAADQESGLE